MLTPEYQLHAFCQALGLDLEKKAALLDIARKLRQEVRDQAEKICLGLYDRCIVNDLDNVPILNFKELAAEIRKIHIESI